MRRMARLARWCLWARLASRRVLFSPVLRAGQGGGVGLAAGLGDRRDVQRRVDAPVAAEVEPVLGGLAAAFAHSPRLRTLRSRQLHKIPECHCWVCRGLLPGGCGPVLRSAVTRQNAGRVPVVRRVASSVGPAGALLSRWEPDCLDSVVAKRPCRSRTRRSITSSRSTP